MNRFLAALALLLLAAVPAAAQTNVVWGLATGANPRNLCVYDSTHACVTTGTLDSTLHVFTPSVPNGTITSGMLAAGVAAANLGFTPLSPANNLSDLTSATTARTNLGLGTAAVANTGTSGATLCLLNGACVWSGADTFATIPTFTAGQLPPANGGTGLSTFTRSGNTTDFATATGTLTSGHCVSIDANGNFIDAGGTCTTSGGGGTVTAGTVGQLAYYSGTTNTSSFALAGDCTFTYPNVTCLKTNGVTFSALATITPGSGVATALAASLNATGGLVGYSGALGTPTSGTLTNATGLPISTGLTGAGTGVITALGNTLNVANGLVGYSGALGTPTSGTLTNATGLPLSTGVSGTLAAAQEPAHTGDCTNTAGSLALTCLKTNGVTFSALATITPGSGVSTALGNTLNVANGLVGYSGALGTPTSGTLTNATGLPISTGLTGAGTGVITALGNTLNVANGLVGYSGALGTPTSGTLTNATGLPISTGVSGLGSGVATALAASLNASTGLVSYSGALGTPTSGTLTNATGLPISTGVSGLGANIPAALGTALNGTGALSATSNVTLTTPNLGTPSTIVLTNATGLPISTGVSGLGSGVATALAASLNASTGLVSYSGALGTPTSGTLTNATGLPISTGVSGLGSGVATALAASLNASTGLVSYSGALGTPTSGTLTNATGLPISTGLTGAGTGVITALGTALNGTGALSATSNVTLTTPNLGTPSTIVLTNATGLPLSTGVSGTLAAAQEPAHTGDATNTAGSLALTLATVNAGSGSVGSSTAIPVLTTNAKGLVTAQTTAAVVAPAGTLTGTLATAAFPALTGDVTTTAGALATTIAANAVTNAKSAQMAALTLKGNATGSTANAADLTGAQAAAILPYQVSVKQYGALGNSNGTTGNGNDDTSAINAAIAASTSVYFPCGIYRVTATIGASVVQAMHRLWGEGSCSKIYNDIAGNTSTTMLLTSSSGCYVCVRVEGLNFIPPTNPTGTVAISQSGMFNSILKGNYFYGYYHPIYLTLSYAPDIEENYANNLLGSLIATSGDVSLNNAKIWNNGVFNSGATNSEYVLTLNCGGALHANLSVIGNDLELSYGGVNFVGCNSVDFSDNYVENMTNGNWLFSGSANASYTVNNNWFGTAGAVTLGPVHNLSYNNNTQYASYISWASTALGVDIGPSNQFLSGAGIGALPTPTVSSCGTSPSMLGGSTRDRGQLFEGTGSTTSCTVAFELAFAQIPICVVTPNTVTGITLTSVSTTGFVISNTASSGGSFFYTCRTTH